MKELYMQDDVLRLDRAMQYVRKVSYKMRQYNIDNSCDDDNNNDDFVGEEGG